MLTKIKEAVKSVNWKDLLERAGWTFVEGFIFALPALSTLGHDGIAWKSALAGAAMAGISAVKTFVINLIQQYLADKTA